VLHAIFHRLRLTREGPGALAQRPGLGESSRIPTIWLYANNDSLFGPKLVERMQSAYLDGGGDVKLVMFDKFGNDGHFIFSEAAGRVKWLMEMDAFLGFHDLPAARRRAQV
jgi:pimeloyl-ACP methyl ester carboxylesterase